MRRNFDPEDEVRFLDGHLIYIVFFFFNVHVIWNHITDNILHFLRATAGNTSNIKIFLIICIQLVFLYGMSIYEIKRICHLA